MVADAFNLQRFVEAQQPIFGTVLEELRRGWKQTHWMWFVFPQIQGLGRSATAQHFALSGLEETRAYLDHPVLGPRLRECSQALIELEGDNPERVLGSIDALKLHSSMTLFSAVSRESLFGEVLLKYYGGSRDSATLAILDKGQA